MNAKATDFVRLVRGEHKLEVIFNEAEDAKWANVGDKTMVTGMVSAISAIKFDRYHVIEPGRMVLKESLKELQDELVVEGAGYARGNVLADLVASGLVGRTREIEPNGWYRLNWRGQRFVTEDVVYLDYTEGEYEGAGGPKHNRRALKMLDGFSNLEKAAKKGMNVRLFWLPELDVYMDKILNNVELIDSGEIDKAKENYQQAATVAGVRGTYRRMEAKHIGLEANGDETFVLFDGEVVPVVDLFGKNAQLVIGNVTVPFVYTISAENAAVVAATAKRQGARLQVLEQ